MIELETAEYMKQKKIILYKGSRGLHGPESRAMIVPGPSRERGRAGRWQVIFRTGRVGVNEMCLSVFLKGFKQKSLIFLLLLGVVAFFI